MNTPAGLLSRTELLVWWYGRKIVAFDDPKERDAAFDWLLAQHAREAA